MNFLKHNWRKLAAGLILCVIAFVLAVNNQTEKSAKTPESSDTVTLTILGNVGKPGSYQIRKGSTLNDNLLVFGGFTDNADASNLDLNAPIEKDVKITVKKRTSKDDKNSDDYKNLYELPK